MFHFRKVTPGKAYGAFIVWIGQPIDRELTVYPLVVCLHPPEQKIMDTTIRQKINEC